MKKLVYAGLFFVATSCFAVEQEMIAAIEQSSLSRVMLLIDKLESEKMTPQARKKVYSKCYDFAVNITKARRATLSVFGSLRDMAMTAAGGCCAWRGVPKVFASALALIEAKSGTSRSVELIKASYGLLWLGGASYLLYKGLTCSSQQYEVDTAKGIEKVLEEKLKLAKPEKK